METTTNVKHRSFTYSTDVVRLGERAGVLSSKGKQDFRVASPPEFKGEAGVWTPEDLFVAAVDSCTMMTFLSLALRHSVPVLDYESHATGILEFMDGKYRFSKVILSPRIVIERVEDVDRVKLLVDEAHASCFVANSIRSEVRIEPTISVG